MAKTKLHWQQIDATFSDAKLQKAYEVHMQQRRPVMESIAEYRKKELAKIEASRKAFETLLIPALVKAALVTDAEHVEIGYNFGRLAFAQGEAPKAKNAVKL